MRVDLITLPESSGLGELSSSPVKILVAVDDDPKFHTCLQ